MAFDNWFDPASEREEELLRFERSRCTEVNARGAMPLRPLDWNEYRDTHATIAEFRTHDLAAKLTFDDVDDGYELSLSYRKWYGRRDFRLSVASRAQAQEWLDRLVARHPFRPFICQVDY